MDQGGGSPRFHERHTTFCSSGNGHTRTLHASSPSNEPSPSRSIPWPFLSAKRIYLERRSGLMGVVRDGELVATQTEGKKIFFHPTRFSDKDGAVEAVIAQEVRTRMKKNLFTSIRSARVITDALCISLFLSHAGCSLAGRSSRESETGWLPQGSLSVSRPIPKSVAHDRLSQIPAEPMLGFMPNKHTRDAVRLRIDTSSGTLSLINGGVVGDAVKAVHLDGMKPGRYRVMLKQRDPAWYATDAYFSRRALPVPSEGSTERFRRGALGSAAIFLEDKTPIFARPFGDAAAIEQLTDDGIKGIMVPQSTLNEMFQTLSVGDIVEVL